MATLGPDGTTLVPEAPNARKAERFLFDLFPQASRVEVQEVARVREFAPIKREQGEHDPASARALVAAEVRRWHRLAGLPEPAEPALRPLLLDAPLE